MDKVAVAGKADGRSDVDSRRPTRFVGATAVTAVDHIEAVHSGLDLRVGGGGNSHASDGGRQRQDRNREAERNVCFHEILHFGVWSKSPFSQNKMGCATVANRRFTLIEIEAAHGP